ncbi:acyl--CoA ligase [Nocardioides dongxiaopingii]|uniref:class I adenylate-forming enzyme family protein n=1 Tax=Nocardioides sp. S-1144 TaxID=2582905 RepID=UPI0011627D26|nr:class I adenylate-forming enzyme family protein [Nocardioides sp. S-1144]QDH11031.1 acyl--CoA ligase [Nocardioides sp. S-1144]
MATLLTPAGGTSFAEVERRALEHAAEVRDLGAAPGHRVALKAANSAEWLAWFLGLAHAGASIVLVDPRTPHALTARRLASTGADLLVTDEPGPWPGRILPVRAGGRTTPTDDGAGATGALDLERWRVLPDALVMASGGSTGDPKPVAKSGTAFLANLEANIEAMGHRPDDVFWPILPMPHQYGLGMAMIAWRLDADLVLCPAERIDVGLRLAGPAGVTVVDGTPTTWRTLLALAERRAEFARALERVRLPCSGAAPLPPALAEQGRRRFGVPLLDSYGSTELGNLTFAVPGRPTACGPPVRGVRIEVRAADGRRLPPGCVGEIHVSHEHVMSGYLVDGQIEPVEVVDGWCPTGDLGSLDVDGALHVVGRAEVLGRGPTRTYPAAVEHRLREAGVPGGVVVLADQRRGRLVCFAEARSEEQQQLVRGLVATVCVGEEAIDDLRLVAGLPTNLNGKPDRAALLRLLDRDDPGGSGRVVGQDAS